MKTKFYFMTCLTNLHVGNGDVNFNVIDKEVERDPVTGYPTINPSGIKGSLRRYFEQNEPRQTVKLFGSSVQESIGSASTPGSLKFLSAQMLARPARASEGASAFYMVTTKTALDQFCVAVLALAGNKPFQTTGISPCTDYRIAGKDVGVEGYSVHDAVPESPDIKRMKDYLKDVLGENFLILSNETYRKIPLPVVARNYLENGESKNLWYEELVPHESVFWFAVLGDEADLERFDAAINHKVVQFGGNASVGCGLCMLKGGISNVEATNQ